MPLIDLQTNLKSLKYGLDRPGGGSSGLPYVQFPLPENASTEVLEFYENNRTNLDFPIRGGGFNLGDVGPYVGQAAKYDRLRIERFLKDSPRGTIFILKQQALQLANPKIQVGAQINLDLGVLPFRYVGNLENTRIYNGGKNTLAQVGVQGSGIHFDRHGMVPINPYQQTYIYVANDNNNSLTNNGVPLGNRLYNLYQTKIATQGRIRLDSQDVNLGTLNTLGISRNPDLLIQYPGGPSSVGGLGLTTIHRRVNSVISTLRTELSYSSSSLSEDGKPGPSLEELYKQVIVGNSPIDVYRYKIDESQAYATKFNTTTVIIPRVSDTEPSDIVGTRKATTNIRNLSYTFNYNQLQAAQSSTTIGIPNIKADFRKTLAATGSAAGKLAFTDGYDGANNIATKYGTGNPGSPTLKRVRYNESVDVNGNPIDITQDKVNMLDIGQTADSAGNLVNDMVKFRFDTLEVDSAGTALGAAGTTPLVFRAFLTNFQDNHSAEYTSFRYTGRGENFYTYNGFTREISFNFKIAAQSRSEMRVLYRKLNYLTSQLYPDYQQFVGGAETGFMRAPLIQLTVGDYVLQQPGFLKTMNLSVSDDSPWEIVSNELEGAPDNDMYQLPHMIEATTTFVPVHNFLPRRSWIGYDGTTHITPLITPNTPGQNRFGIGIL